MCKIVTFEVGCRGCRGFIKTDKNSYVCSKRAHMDDSPIIPLKDGKKTADWYICKGRYYTGN